MFNMSLLGKRRVNDLLKGPGTDNRKSPSVQTGFARRAQKGIAVGGHGCFLDDRLEAWIIHQMILKLVALLFKGQAPAITAQNWLVAPLEQMHQQDRQPADQFALLASAHALDFLGDKLDIRLGQTAGAQQPGLFIGPGVEIPVVKLPITHAVLLFARSR